MKRCVLLAFVGLCFQVGLAQVEYEVTTLLPQNSQLLDDGLTLDENGTVYGARWGIWQGVVGRHILRYRVDGTYDTLATGFNRPNGITYSNGALYVANSGTGELMRVDTFGTIETLNTLSGGITNIIPVTGTDSLILVSWGQPRIMARGSNGTIHTLVSSSLINGPAGVVRLEDGRIFVGNFNDGRVILYQEGQIEVFANLGGGIGFLAYADSSLFATNIVDKKVYKIEVSDGSVEVIAGSGSAQIVDGIGTQASFISPNGIVATPTGDTLYVSEHEGTALRRIIRKQPATSIADPLQGSTNIRIFPLPSSGVLEVTGLDISQLSGASLYDASGRLVQEFAKASFVSGALDVSQLSEGVYTLCLKGNKGAVFHREQILIRK